MSAEEHTMNRFLEAKPDADRSARPPAPPARAAACIDGTRAPSRAAPAERLRGARKLLPRSVLERPDPPRPAWIRARAPGRRARALKALLREAGLVSVCEEARCPNLGECFGRGVATFMILGDRCTRRCAFCDVAHGRPRAPDPDEPRRLADTIARLGLRHAVVTSVDRDDLRDGGAAHFAACVRALRARAPETRVELLTPDFRGRAARALDILQAAPGDVFNHNVETVPRLYRRLRPGADYAGSLALLAEHKRRLPQAPTKSGLMLGLGETDEEVVRVMADLRAHRVDMLTVGQYLRPGAGYAPVARYVPPAGFERFARLGQEMGFAHVAAAPLARSSYHADRQAAVAAGGGSHPSAARTKP